MVPRITCLAPLICQSPEQCATLLQINRIWSLSLAINQQMLSEVLPTLSISRATVRSSRGLSVGALDDGLLDCFVRLTRLLDTPLYISSIGELIQREILCRLLLGSMDPCCSKVSYVEAALPRSCRSFAGFGAIMQSPSRSQN